MGHDREVQLHTELHRLGHHQGVLDRIRLVAGGDDSGPFHGREIRELLPFHTARQCSHRCHEDASRLGRCRSVEDEIDQRRVIERRIGVGHAADGRISGRGRGLGTGGDGLPVGLPGLAKMDMGVDEARRDPHPGAIVDLVQIGVVGDVPDLDDLVVLDHKPPPRCRVPGRGPGCVRSSEVFSLVGSNHTVATTAVDLPNSSFSPSVKTQERAAILTKIPFSI